MASIKIDVPQAEADVRELKRIASECYEAQRNITALIARIPLEWQGEASEKFIGTATKYNVKLLRYADDLSRQAKGINAIIKEYERMDAEIARKIKNNDVDIPVKVKPAASERKPQEDNEIHDLKDLLEETGSILGKIFDNFK